MGVVCTQLTSLKNLATMLDNNNIAHEMTIALWQEGDEWIHQSS